MSSGVTLMALLIILLGLLLGGIYCLEEINSIPINYDFATQVSRWEQTPSYAPTPGNFGREYTPSIYCPSPSRTDGEPSTPLHRLESGRLGFLDDAELNRGAYNEDAPKSTNYLIEWKVTLNNRPLAKDTEQDLVFKPSSYWQQIKEKAERILQRKKSRNQRVRPDDTTVVVAVNERSQRDLTKRFENTDIDWTAIEKQLLQWENLFRQGKKLRLFISINYLEDSNPSPSKTDKRGNTSTTNGMLCDLDDQVTAENSTGQPSVWREVYRKMRCPGPPCHHEGQYCWVDPVGKKHYKMRTHHMKALVKYVQQGGILETHDDIPDTVRDQLYAEERQRTEKRQKGPDPSTSGSIYPPININFGPTQSSHPPITSHSCTETTPTVQVDSMDIPGPTEVAVEEYTNWHLSQVSTENFRENIRKARDIVLDNIRYSANTE
ncbi:uncharacterized protein ATNIH1004_011675 [Aspergillus tanneri]|uniref:Uncharacterized protein n=1 Tax=Aspergillus tanneri TaxID=1220188 RepID=A0A5M9MAG9_9EURO|nr:uncharacterized protein ATNIH1004_011675 [Aspergillus tanneri]KAA8641539.1 hypothetical protein ATNIH1004_011675 [Aspergillus tanneri]